MNPLLLRLTPPDRLLRLWALVRDLFERETQKNPRIHLGFLGILAILLLGLVFQIEDGDGHVQVQIDADAQQLATMRRLAGQAEWQARRETVQRLRVQLESRLWEAESDGLAQANFQDLIGKFARDANIQHVDTHVEIVNASPGSQNYRQMSATVTGSFSAPAFQKFLASLDTDGHILAVDRLKVETTPVPRFEMLLSTFLRPNGQPDASKTDASKTGAPRK
jgi:hypothetical protein